MIFSRSLTRGVGVAARASSSNLALPCARHFHPSPSTSRIFGTQPVRAKEAPAPLNAAKGYPIIDHE